MELKVKGRPDLVRDLSTNAIINTNINKAAKAKRLAAKAQEREQEFQEVKQELAELKSMLKELLDR
jgi:hypothetical protein